ncbi:hypothetical protein Ahy_A09g043961 isoform A [Arachis hypogaea]|uniref:Uncharacterized protein n=1 Tax=Arachis hypogaea TaxID=3818 RepID=A0A445BJD1_ARAHY|nr:hypothetical protein Ahy_A09g043961 isoform A [Arachis hypogaea]
MLHQHGDHIQCLLETSNAQGEIIHNILNSMEKYCKPEMELRLSSAEGCQGPQIRGKGVELAVQENVQCETRKAQRKAKTTSLPKLRSLKVSQRKLEFESKDAASNQGSDVQQDGYGSPFTYHTHNGLRRCSWELLVTDDRCQGDHATFFTLAPGQEVVDDEIVLNLVNYCPKTLDSIREKYMGHANHLLKTPNYARPFREYPPGIDLKHHENSTLFHQPVQSHLDHHSYAQSQGQRHSDTTTLASHSALATQQQSQCGRLLTFLRSVAAASVAFLGSHRFLAVAFQIPLLPSSSTPSSTLSESLEWRCLSLIDPRASENIGVSEGETV